MYKLAFLSLALAACTHEVLVTQPDGAPTSCNMDPDAAKDAAERAWLERTPVCNVTDNVQFLIRENCLNRHALNGLPCKVCVGFNACITPIADMYCADLNLGCQDPACPTDQPLH